MSAEWVAAVLAEIDRRIRITRAAAPSDYGDWYLAVLRQHKAVLERHARHSTSAWGCVQDGYPWPCPDVQGVLDCYPEATP